MTLLPRPAPLSYPAADYLACGIGGILSCGITHTMVTPLDVVKCNMQVRGWGGGWVVRPVW